MNKFSYKNLTPFKWFVLENFPFIEADFDALTEWQLFCKLGKEINKIIDSQNIVGEQAETLTNAFNTLKNYVDNYFNNLDVQDEINNKLNEMAQDGTLQEIITSYLNVNGILAFNTVNDMKNATNLIDGSFCKTYGFYNYNDGGGSFYKIRNITNKDIVNNMNIISLNNYDNLIAELISNDFINVKQYGAKGDGISDDINFIQTCLNNNTDKTVFFPTGKYLISSPINTIMYQEEPGNIILDNTAEIFTNNQLECIIYLGNGTGKGKNTGKDGVFRLKSHLKGGIINAKNCESGIKLKNNFADIYIEDVKILYFNKYGVYFPLSNNNQSSNASFSNIEIDGNTSSEESYGFYIERPDNKYNNIIINSVQQAFHITKGGQILKNIHALMVGYDENHQALTNYSEWYENTKAIYIEGGAGGNIINEFYNDTFCTFLECSNDNNNSFILTNSFSMSYLPNLNQKLFIFNQDQPLGIIENNSFDFNTPLTKHQGIIFNNYEPQNITNSNLFKLSKNIINQTDRLVNGDILTKIDNTYSPFWLNSQMDIPSDKWLLIGYIPITKFCDKKFSISIDRNIFDVIFRIDSYDNISIGNVLNGNTIKNTNLGIDIGFKYDNNINGYPVASVYIKRTSGTAKCNIDISNMNSSVLFCPINQYRLDPNQTIDNVDYSYSL